jgi:transcriptional regulator with XRE-family HTH domain
MAPARAYVPSLRLQEHRLKLGLTQEAVAEELARLAWVHYGMRVGVNADMVGKWERGEKRPSKLYRRLLGRLYQATEEGLGLRAPIGAGVDGGSLTDVNRRDFLRHSALAGAAVLTFPEWLSRAGATEASDRLAWALERPSQVDLAMVSDMETITAAHRRSYRQLSVHALLPQTESQFQAVTELLQRPQPLRLRQRLIAIAGETAVLAGTLRFIDLYEFELGRSNRELVMTAAREAEAGELGAFILGCMGFHARYSGNHKQAVDLIEQARKVAETVASPLTRGWLAAVASEIHATAGDAKASLRALEWAGHALGEAHQDDEASWIGIGTFNHAKLEAYHGVCYLQLGRPADAVPALTRALDTLDPALKKHRCTALADLATGLIQLHEVEEGCERASQSLTLAAELRHGVSIDRIRKLRQHLRPWQRSPAVRQLTEQLAAVA